jgi:N-methylhydantoinase B
MSAVAIAERDPVVLSLIQGALSNIQEEMTSTIMRSGRSNVATIARDYSNAIFDAGGEMVLQGQDIPVHLGSLIFGLRAVADRFGPTARPGDIYYHNDPALGGSHIADFCAYKPVFVDDRLAFWAVSKLHVVDAGGPVPGSYNMNAREIYAEGLRIPPIKLVDRGVMRDDILGLILANLRTNENQAGDIRAQLGAVGVAERRLLALCRKYGLPTIEGATDGLKQVADRQMRTVISETPDGSSTVTTSIDDMGHGLGALEITVTATVEDDRLTITLDSPPQIPFYLNSYMANTISSVYLGVLVWAQLPPPYNQGLYRSITVDCGAPGTLCNAQLPAPCMFSTSIPCENLADATRRALAGLMPRRPMAQWGLTYAAHASGVDPRNDEYFVNNLLMTEICGGGAVEGLMDGWHAVGPANTLGAITCGDTELIESIYPMLIAEYSIRKDSGGAGRWRGGCGTSLHLQPLGDLHVAAFGQGLHAPALGTSGAVDRMPERKLSIGRVFRPDGTDEDVTNTMFVLRPGETYLSACQGGGGAGDPFLRDPERVARDVRNQRVSVDAAEVEYGVKLDPETLAVDHDATARLRAEVTHTTSEDR